MPATLYGRIKARLEESGRNAYPQRLPQGATLPAITFARISHIPATSHDTSGPGLAQERWQFTAWAEGYSEAQELAETLESLFSGYRDLTQGVNRITAALPVGMVDLFDPETQRHYVPVDVMIWGTTT